MNRFLNSIWLFPAIMAIPVILFTMFQIHGSSIGAYNSYFYGESAKDPNLLLGEPRLIRSDEWQVNSQMTIAQKNSNFERINQNIGAGQDVSLLLDVPYKDWSIIFKPHNLAFFAMPLDNAFAFRWWVMGFLLITSCYLFTLALLPAKKLLAALLSVAFFFSPFIQWWYVYGTVGSIYYSFFAGAILIKLLEEKRTRWKWFWGFLLAYVVSCFALILYPPFQIPCALAMAVFGLGYFIKKIKNMPTKQIWQNLGIITTAVVTAGVITASFLWTRLDAVHALQNTAYPGTRNTESGGFDVPHLFSSHLSVQFQRHPRAAQYHLPSEGTFKPINQSESSNFILLTPFFILPAMFLLINGYRKRKQIDWLLLVTTSSFLLLVVMMCTPWLNWLFNLFLMGKVPPGRLIIGVGLLGIIHTVLVIRNLLKLNKLPRQFHKITAVYALVVFAFLVYIGLVTMNRSPGFIGLPTFLALSIPVPVVIYLLLNRRFTLAMAVFLLFSILSSGRVNPLYRGLEVVTDSSLSREIRALSLSNPGRWIASDDLLLENMALANGAPSLSGVYIYPQLDLWKSLDSNENIYNRYAHIIFTIDRNPAVIAPTSLKLIDKDYIQVNTEPCSDFLKNHNVRFLITVARTQGQDNCAQLLKTINYPTRDIFIYKLF